MDFSASHVSFLEEPLQPKKKSSNGPNLHPIPGCCGIPPEAPLTATTKKGSPERRGVVESLRQIAVGKKKYKNTNGPRKPVTLRSK